MTMILRICAEWLFGRKQPILSQRTTRIWRGGRWTPNKPNRQLPAVASIHLFSIFMNLIDKRAIKIVQLQEELEEAKRIITEFVWPGDGTKESNQRFQQKAARFAGCTVPIFDGQPERPNSLENADVLAPAGEKTPTKH